jgi:MoaA/NifB/PqqE/SkfB family radical SAM enzyme
MKKQCPEHGNIDSVVEIDTEFYYSLQHDQELFPQAVLFEVTDKCQLTCPHCYHLPDNKNIDRPIDQIVEQMKMFPEDCFPFFAGAEPTLRKDFVNLIAQTKKLNFKLFSTLTNGIKFADREFAQQCFDAGLENILFGLNHHSYQGKKVHQKQLRGLKNMLDIGYNIEYVGYTIESLDHLPDILKEICKIKTKKTRFLCKFFLHHLL